MRFVATNQAGRTLVMDDYEGGGGPSPIETILASLAGCTGMDVISILRKKRQPVDAYEVRVSGEQMDEHPHAFTRFDVVHVVDGTGLDVEAVRRAIELSATRYCSVGSTLASGVVEIHHAYLVREPGGDERYGEVLVVGPDVAPAALAAR
jgi:putative redox protein